MVFLKGISYCDVTSGTYVYIFQKQPNLQVLVWREIWIDFIFDGRISKLKDAKVYCMNQIFYLDRK